MSVTRRRDPAARRLLRALVAALAAVVAVTAVAGCGGDGGDSGDEGRVVEIVVPLGTQERLDRGEDVVVMPAELRFEVGDTLRIRNDDVVDHPVGPYKVSAGQEFEMRYGAPGHYVGMCPLTEGKTYEIVITE
jgi:plastocyanin